MKIELDDKLIKKIKQQLNIIVVPLIFMLVAVVLVLGVDRPISMIDYNIRDLGSLIIGVLFGLTSIIIVHINVNYQYLKEIIELLEVKKWN